MKRWIRRPHLAAQTAFAVAAIAASVALPVVLLSVGGGVSDHELSQLENAGYEITVSAPGLHGISGAHALSTQIDRLGGVGAASPILSAPVDAYSGTTGPLPTLAEGVIPSAFAATEGPDLQGLFPSPLPLGDPNDTLTFAAGQYDGPRSADVLLAVPFAESLGAKIGSTIELAPGPSLTGALSFEVTGEIGATSELGPTAAYAIVLPLTELQLVTGFARTNGSTGAVLDAADTLQVSVAGAGSTEPAEVARVAAEVQSLVPDYGVSTSTSEAQQLRQADAVLNGFYLALSSIGLTIGLVFLTLVLVRRVDTERTAIGVRRALGLPTRSIAGLMGGRALLLGGGGALGGVASGWALVELLARFGSPSVEEAVGFAVFDPVELGALVVAILALSLLGSLAATRAALRLSIPEALR